MEYSIAEKLAYVEEYKSSGLNQTQFAKEKGIMGICLEPK